MIGIKYCRSVQGDKSGHIKIFLIEDEEIAKVAASPLISVTLSGINHFKVGEVKSYLLFRLHPEV
jgi:hypothetical protein